MMDPHFHVSSFKRRLPAQQISRCRVGVIMLISVLLQHLIALTVTASSLSSVDVRIVFSITSLQAMALAPADSLGNPCSVSRIDNFSTGCAGGAVRVKDFINHMRSSIGPDVLALDFGYFEGGSSYRNALGTNFSAFIWRQLGFNVSLLSVRDLAEVEPPSLLEWLSIIAPVRPVMTNARAVSADWIGAFSKWQVFNLTTGHQVALISILEQVAGGESQYPNYEDVISFSNPFTEVEYAISAVTEIRELYPHCNTIAVFLIHSSHEIIRRIAHAVPYLNIIFSSHNLHESDFSLIDTPFGHSVLVTSARRGPQYISTIEFGVDRNGVTVNGTWRRNVTTLSLPDHPMNVNDSMWTDVIRPAILIAEERNSLAINANSPNPNELDFLEDANGIPWCSKIDCAVARLVTDALLYGCTDCDAVIINTGSLGGGFERRITRGQLISALPFNNVAVILDLSGSELVSTLEDGLWVEPHYGSFPTVAGMKYAFNSAAPRRERVVEVDVINRITGRLEPIVRERTYRVMVNNFMRSGGDDYVTLVGASAVVDSGPELRSLVESYVKAMAPFDTQSMLDAEATCASNPTSRPVLGTPCRILKSSLRRSVWSNCRANADMPCDISSEVRARYFGDSVNTSCICSGMGTCDGLTCTCDVPEQGFFRGFQVARGTGCDDVLTLNEMSPAWRAVAYCMLFISVLTCIAASTIYWWYRGSPIVVSSAPMFLHLTNLGGVILCGGAFALILDPFEHQCMIALWLNVTGFVITFGSLIVKTWRIDMIFNATALKRQIRVSDGRLLVGLLGMYMVPLVVLIVFQAVDPPKGSPHIIAWEYQHSCHSDLSLWFMGVLALVNIAMVVLATVYAHRVRNVPENYNETRFLYTAAKCEAATLASFFIVQLVLFEKDWHVRVLLAAFFVCFFVFGTQGVLLLSKIHALRVERPQEVTPQTSVQTSRGTKWLAQLRDVSTHREALLGYIIDLKARVQAACPGVILPTIPRQVSSHTRVSVMEGPSMRQLHEMRVAEQSALCQTQRLGSSRSLTTAVAVLPGAVESCSDAAPRSFDRDCDDLHG